jgi:hypothetical protein
MISKQILPALKGSLMPVTVKEKIPGFILLYDE